MSYCCPVGVAWVVQRKILSSLWECWLGMTILRKKRKCDKLSLEHCTSKKKSVGKAWERG